MKALHFGAKYWAFYLGRDGFYPSFHGKYGYTVVKFGSGSYMNSTAEMSNLPNYILGDENLVLKIA
jgi:hypothetical protein